MDLSGIIFVVLAIGWAAYLLPLALKHHDEVDRSRPVEEFSGSLRVLGRAVARKVVPAEPAGPSTPSVETREPVAHQPVSTLTREAAREAARRRRRVLALLLTTLVAVTITSAFSLTPWFTTAIPGVLIVAFLVVARLTVRAQQVRRAAPVQQNAADEVATQTADETDETQADLGTEETAGISRADLVEAVAAPVLDDGGLWDPLPVTLPTYVTKARARRTVRTIELTTGTTGVTSSGHDAGDSALAREAAEAQAAPETVEQERKAAGA